MSTNKYRRKYGVRKSKEWASLVVQGMRIFLPVQVTQAPSPSREDPTGRGAAKLLSARALGPPAAEGAAAMISPRTAARESPPSNKDPAQPKIR